MEPKEVFLSTEKDAPSRSRIVSVSAGAFHVVALSEDGTAYSWGINSNDRLGLGPIDYSDLAHEIPEEKKESLVVIEWVSQIIGVTHKSSNAAKRTHRSRNKGGAGTNGHSNTTDPDNRIALACAGYDSSMLVTESGQVLTFGKRSGRLGKGETSSNVATPQPLYGGLHLFHLRRSDGGIMPPSEPRPRRLQRRASASIVE